MMRATARQRRLRRLAPWMVVLAAMAPASCHHEVSKRGRVHGTVTLDGAPLAKGQFRILAVSDGAIGTAGDIVNGTYDIPPERGPTAGTYRVEIVSMKATGRQVRDPDTNELVGALVNELPARFHSASTLQMKYEPGGTQTF